MNPTLQGWLRLRTESHSAGSHNSVSDDFRHHRERTEKAEKEALIRRIEVQHLKILKPTGRESEGTSKSLTQEHIAFPLEQHHQYEWWMLAAGHVNTGAPRVQATGQ